ncbi:MAG: type IV secretory system conjugative DNA transfer family protein, partial [Alphaproteobacteria bacterium]
PHEVMHLGADEEVLLVRGLRPIRAQKIPYFQSNLNEYADPNPMMVLGQPGETA